MNFVIKIHFRQLNVIDSSAIPVCGNKRIHRHKVFAGLAARSKTTMGWFFGFKLHLVINRHGEIVAIKLTSGNTDDRAPMLDLTDGLEGILLADKGYILHRPEKWAPVFG